MNQEQKAKQAPRWVAKDATRLYRPLLEGRRVWTEWARTEGRKQGRGLSTNPAQPKNTALVHEWRSEANGQRKTGTELSERND